MNAPYHKAGAPFIMQISIVTTQEVPMRLRVILLLTLLLGVGAAAAQDDLQPATIVNDEGGPANISGTLTYSNLLFTSGVSEPLIILESEAGFVDRNLHAVLPVESQVLGQITSDFYTSPVSYT